MVSTSTGTDRTELNDNPNATAVLKRGYLQPGEKVSDDIFRRVAAAVAEPERGDGIRLGERVEQKRFEKYRDEFYNIMSGGYFLPSTPTLMHAGVISAKDKKPKCLSACFMDSPSDDLESITRVGYEIPFIESAGGGVGWGLSKLRPKGDKIYDRTGACGPIDVLHWYAQAGRTFTQGAVRPGAHMAQLHISHPDIEEFIHCKDSCTSPDDPLANVNISVQIPDAFMYALDNGLDWSLINPRNGVEVRRVEARDLWRQICESAWTTGDPGVVFIDRVNTKDGPLNPEYGSINGSNPCGEQFLEDKGSCNLGSINLARYAGPDGYFNQDLLKEHICIAVRFLDNVVDINHFPFERQREVNLGTRRIGLGVMGLADALAIMGIPYNSVFALEFVRKLSYHFQQDARTTSLALGQEKGELREGHPARNSAVTTVAPTGSISIIAGCSSGIEPYFSLFCKRKALWSTDGKEHDVELLEIPAPLRERIEHRMPDLDIDAIADELVSLNDDAQREWVVQNLGMDTADLFPTAHSIDPSEHVKMQAAWQENIDNGISKTVNLRHNAPVADINHVLHEAYTLRCKSVTVYRDGSKGEQVLTNGHTTTASAASDAPHAASGRAAGDAVGLVPPTDGVPRPRPSVPQARVRSLSGFTTAVETGHGQWYFTINTDPETGQPIEVFITSHNNDPCVRAASVAVSKLVSLSLRSGVDVRVLADGLRGLDCGHTHWSGGVLVKSPWDALANLLSNEADPDPGVQDTHVTAILARTIVSRPGTSCVTCGGRIIHVNGCATCQGCGSNNCG